jgi:hypothetical protein
MALSITHLHNSFIFVGEARSLPLEWSLVRGTIQQHVLDTNAGKQLS